MDSTEHTRGGRIASRRGLLGLGVLAVLAGPPAFALELTSPVACELGVDCFVFQHVDRDPGPGAQDFRCQPLAYDGHKGVDFALPTEAAMRAGVDVLAAAPGTVRGTRDGMADVSRRDPSAPDIGQRECGNGVAIIHADGWTTQYCHLKVGTIAVSQGEQVSAGQRLGQIGLSGNTEFPHLHLTVRQGDTVIDTFDRRPMDAPCEPASDATGLWSEASGVTYVPGGAMSAGILDRIPDYAEVNATAPTAAAVPRNAPALVHWAHFFGLRKGDVIASRLTGPDGTVVAEERYVMDRNRIRQFRAVGRRMPAEGWPTGTYDGLSRLVREGQVVDEIATTTRIP